MSWTSTNHTRQLHNASLFLCSSPRKVKRIFRDRKHLASPERRQMLTRQTKKKTTESLNNFYLSKHISLSIHSCVSTIKFSRISRLRATFWQLVDGRLIKNFSPLFWQMRAAEGEDEEISEAAPICHEWLNKISFYIVFHSWEGEAREKIWRHGTRRTSRCWLMIRSFARAARELTNSIYALICQMPSRCFASGLISRRDYLWHESSFVARRVESQWFLSAMNQQVLAQLMRKRFWKVAIEPGNFSWWWDLKASLLICERGLSESLGTMTCSRREKRNSSSLRWERPERRNDINVMSDLPSKQMMLIIGLAANSSRKSISIRIGATKFCKANYVTQNVEERFTWNLGKASLSMPNALRLANAIIDLYRFDCARQNRSDWDSNHLWGARSAAFHSFIFFLGFSTSICRALHRTDQFAAGQDSTWLNKTLWFPNKRRCNQC